ncbi:MAG: glycosyltransferase family 4 protein [Kastovskya adunca ATA6-11-RM4]|nr:glycosyltransferase family 4 protein [Kastovskya adunca ATA6-11-RM4]
MRSVRLLIVTHAPLAAEFGAGQVAINLAEALRSQGHDVTLWSPHPLPSQTKWWQSVRQMRSKLDAFIKTQAPFDVIDSPALLITPQVSKSALVVARSVQPDILYLMHSLKDRIEKSVRGIIRLPFSYSYSLFQIILVLQGWKRARYILCLGSLELRWMKRGFPWWRNKLMSYVNALSQAEQEALAKVRIHRKKPSPEGIRFLWIGRWTSHKGITELLDFIVKWAALCPQDTFTIAGCGTEAENDCPAELLQSGQLKILPSFERNELYSLLANHDCGLFTSRVEGWGLVLNEMLESGMLVFATPIGGVPDLQPFFPENLKVFPPPLGFKLESFTNSIFQDDYYNVFSWESIAQTYAMAIFDTLNSQKIPTGQLNP